MGWFAHPIFSESGGYPDVMIEQIKLKCLLNEDRLYSRLPHMSNTTKNFIRGSADFLGLNYYTSRNVELSSSSAGQEQSQKRPPSWEDDTQIVYSVDEKWIKSFMYSVPKGLGDTLRWIRDQYNNVEVVITENGWSDGGELNDTGRINYLKV